MRIGNFTSSEIFNLMANGKKEGELGAPALTYIKECNMERRLGRQLENDQNARPTSWGNLCEGYVFSMLPLSLSARFKRFRSCTPPLTVGLAHQILWPMKPTRRLWLMSNAHSL